MFKLISKVTNLIILSAASMLPRLSQAARTGRCLHDPNASTGADIQNTLRVWSNGRQEKLSIKREGVEVVAR
jgi:hypothetical protein